MGRVCNGPSLLWAEMSSYRLYQSTKGWPCLDQSRYTNVSISVETDFDPPEIKFLCFIPLRLRLEDLEFGLFGLFNHISDINTNSCDLINCT